RKNAGLLECSQAKNSLLYLAWRDQDTLALEAVVGAAHDQNVAVGVHPREVAGDEPSIAHGRTGSLFVAEITQKETGIFRRKGQRANVARGQLIKFAVEHGSA